MAASPPERVAELSNRIVALRDAYYRGAPLVADAEYDAIEDELRALLAEHPDLTPDPNPLEQVGAPSVLHAPIRHSRPMLSLEKATKPEQVEAFFARFPGQPVVVMPKVEASLVSGVGDVNGDGYADVFVNLFIPSATADVTHMHLGGSSGPRALPDNVFPFRGLPRGDFNGDGFADVVAEIAVPQDIPFYTDDAFEIHPGDPGGIAATATVRLEEEAPAFMGDILNLFHPTQAADFDNDGYDDLPITAAPSFPTPFYDERPSKVFVVRGGAHGLTSEPALTLSGAPGYGVAFTAGD